MSKIDELEKDKKQLKSIIEELQKVNKGLTKSNIKNFTLFAPRMIKRGQLVSGSVEIKGGDMKAINIDSLTVKSFN